MALFHYSQPREKKKKRKRKTLWLFGCSVINANFSSSMHLLLKKKTRLKKKTLKM